MPLFRSSSSGVTPTNAVKLENKRVKKRVNSQASTASLTPDFDSYDIEEITALAAGLTINAPSGTPDNGDPRVIKITATGSDRSLTWNSIYVGIETELPATAPEAKRLRCLFVYDSVVPKWELLSVKTEE